MELLRVHVAIFWTWAYYPIVVAWVLLNHGWLLLRVYLKQYNGRSRLISPIFDDESQTSYGKTSGGFKIWISHDRPITITDYLSSGWGLNHPSETCSSTTFWVPLLGAPCDSPNPRQPSKLHQRCSWATGAVSWYLRLHAQRCFQFMDRLDSWWWIRD